MINALLGFFWSAGSVAGPVVSGLLISVAGYDGLLMTLFVSGALFLLIQCLGKAKKPCWRTNASAKRMDDISEAAR
ncbi:transporter [Klebsiella michiganensis]|uniref:Transporter n=1 Tax=Klebsiella michiganensis TaxID=1134687 RepID=A0A7H4PLC1_9ENTR|nr:transporter [Klebsiella michiganensis]